MKVSSTQLQLYNQNDIKKVKHDHPILQLLSEESLKNLLIIYNRNKWKI